MDQVHVQFVFVPKPRSPNFSAMGPFPGLRPGPISAAHRTIVRVQRTLALGSNAVYTNTWEKTLQGRRDATEDAL